MLVDILNKFLIIFILVVPNLYLLIIFFRFKKRFREDFFLIIFLFLLSVIFLNKLLFRGQTLSAQDFNNIQIPFFPRINFDLKNLLFGIAGLEVVLMLFQIQFLLIFHLLILFF